MSAESLKAAKTRAMKKRVLEAAMAVYMEMRSRHPATHMVVIEDLLGSYRLTPASVEQIRACHALYEAQRQ